MRKTQHALFPNTAIQKNTTLNARIIPIKSCLIKLKSVFFQLEQLAKITSDHEKRFLNLDSRQTMAKKKAHTNIQTYLP